MERIAKHLQINNIDLDKTPMTLGPWLTLDENRERVTEAKGGDTEAANAPFKDNYRPGFVVPEAVLTCASVCWCVR